MTPAIPDPKSLLERWHKFYGQLAAWTRERMPKGLYARALIIIIAFGLLMMLSARFILRSPFFQIARESDTGPAPSRHGKHS